MKHDKVKVVSVCPFDDLPCDFVDSCDDALSLRFGVDMVKGDSCPRAVRRFKK